MVVRSVARSREHALQRAVEAVVPPEELRAFEARSWTATARTLGVIWLEIVALLAAGNVLGHVSVVDAAAPAVLVMIAMATRINALNVVMHEASHGFLLQRRRLNDKLCNVAAAWWMLHSVEEYRPTHRLHHRYLNTERDPDLASYLLPAGAASLWRLAIRDLVGVTAIRRAVVLVRSARMSEEPVPEDGPRVSTAITNGVGKIAAQAVICGQFVVFQGLLRGSLFYVVFWLVPVLCIFPLILRLKTITEHFDPRLGDERAPIWIARTSRAGRLQDHVIGAQMQYHFEHHVLPTIPYGGLKRLHRRLNAAGFFEHCSSSRREVLSGGYVRFVTHIRELGSEKPSFESVS